MEKQHNVWLGSQVGERCVKNLNNNGFHAQLVSDAKAARALVLELSEPYNSFGFGGSDTTRSLGIPEAVTARGKTVFDHLASGFSLEESLNVVDF